MLRVALTISLANGYICISLSSQWLPLTYTPVWFCVLNTGLTSCSWWSVRDYKWSLYPPGSLTTVWLKCWTQSNFLIFLFYRLFFLSCGRQQLLSSMFCWCLRFTRKIQFCPAILKNEKNSLTWDELYIYIFCFNVCNGRD